MSRSNVHWLVFRVADGRYALPLESVERIVRAAYITPLPLAPRAIAGALDVEGEILPVFDLRARFGLPSRALQPEDQLLIARMTQRRVVLVIDAAEGLIEPPASAVNHARRFSADLQHINGLISMGDGLVLIQDLERFLSADEIRQLDTALERRSQHAG